MGIGTMRVQDDQSHRGCLIMHSFEKIMVLDYNLYLPSRRTPSFANTSSPPSLPAAGPLFSLPISSLLIHAVKSKSKNSP
jgi:hypothetical protein